MSEAMAAGSNRTFCHTKNCGIPRDVLWRYWTDPQCWAEWDEGLEWARLDQPFEPGARGRLKPKNAPAAAFEVTSVNPQQGCSIKVHLPLAELRITRAFAQGKETIFTHAVGFHGVLGTFWAGLYGPKIRRELPQAMTKLEEMAAQSA